MSSIYHDGAVCDISYCEDGLYINRLYVPEPMRGKGIAMSLLTKACAIADERGAKLWVDPVDYYGSNVPRLQSLYARFGFRLYRGGPNMLRRPPPCAPTS